MPIQVKAGFETELLAELRLGLPPLFYSRLIDIPDDWGFVLKLHSFFEGTLTMVVQHKLKLRRTVGETLNERDSFVSRVYLADRLKILEPDYKGFLLGLNKLRNEITHNVRFLDFSLRNYVDGLSEAQFGRTASSLCVGFQNIQLSKPLASCPNPFRPTSSRHPRTNREMFWDAFPRFSIWYAGIPTLDLFALQRHFEMQGGKIHEEPGLEAELQDLLHDPAVLEFRRKLDDLPFGTLLPDHPAFIDMMRKLNDQGWSEPPPATT